MKQRIYKEQAEENAIRAKQAICEHKHWCKKCSHCSAILSSDKLEELKEYEEIKI